MLFRQWEKCDWTIFENFQQAYLLEGGSSLENSWTLYFVTSLYEIQGVTL